MKASAAEAAEGGGEGRGEGEERGEGDALVVDDDGAAVGEEKEEVDHAAPGAALGAGAGHGDLDVPGGGGPAGGDPGREALAGVDEGGGGDDAFGGVGAEAPAGHGLARGRREEPYGREGGQIGVDRQAERLPVRRADGGGEGVGSGEGLHVDRGYPRAGSAAGGAALGDENRGTAGASAEAGDGGASQVTVVGPPAPPSGAPRGRTPRVLHCRT